MADQKKKGVLGGLLRAPQKGLFGAKPNTAGHGPSSPNAQSSAPRDKETVMLDFSAPVIDSKVKEVDQTAAFLEAILKGMRKQQKHCKAYVDSSEDLVSAYQAFAARQSGNDLLAALEFHVKWENTYKMLLNELHAQNTVVQDAIVNWMKTGLEPARAEKKKFQEARRNLEAAALKLSKADPGPKLKELSDERERTKQAYLLQGERTYQVLTDAVELTRFANVDHLRTHYNAYAAHYRAGHEWLDRQKARALEMSERSKKEHEGYEKARGQRPRALWVPEGVLDGGDAASSQSVAATRLFATDYAALIRRTKPPGDLLPFVADCLAYIELHGLESKGIFRESPPKPALDALRAKLDLGQDAHISEQEDVHVVTGLLKLFLREMPAPLLTFELYRDWLTLLDLPDTKLKIARLRELVHALPAPNRVLLTRLCALCLKIMAKTEVNKMTASNLAIVLCPSVLYDKDPDPLTMVQEIQRANGVMVLMLEHVKEVFPEVATTATPPVTPTPTTLTPTPASTPSATNNTPAPSAPVRPATSVKPTPAAPPKPLPSPASASASAPSTPTSRDSRDAILLPTPATPTAPAPIPTPTPAPAITVAPLPPVTTTSSATVLATSEAGSPLQSVRPGQPVDPGVPALPLREVYAQIAAMPSPSPGTPEAASYYWQLFELFEGAYQFAKAALLLKSFSADELAALNSAFQLVGKAIKNMLGFIKEYTSQLPSELARRVVHAANQVRPHIKTLIAFIKAFNSASSGGRELGELLDTTRQFVAGALQMFLTCHLYTQMDAVSLAGLRCQELARELLGAFDKSPTQGSISFVVNNLQNFTLMFTSVLRARLPELSDARTQKQLTGVVEGAEKCIGDIFDEARDILLANALTLTPNMAAKVNELAKLLESVMAMRHLVVGAASGTPVPALLATAAEQLRSITELHQEGDEQNILALVLHLSNLASAIEEVQAAYETRTARAADFITNASKVVQQLSNVKELVNKVADKVDDESLKVMLESYSTALQHSTGQFKLCTVAAALGIEIAGYTEVNVATPLLDLAYVSFPFLYNFRDACSLGTS